jgi:catechol 2,3-dioxygenase-like lactoylglutathione lyase family enzyme
MSYIALATDQFDEVVRFYGETLAFPTVRSWERSSGRGRVFDLHGLRLEILDATREKAPMALGPANDRVHVVVEVPNADEVHLGLPIDCPPPITTNWGARLFRVRDPDGVPVWFLQWLT